MTARETVPGLLVDELSDEQADAVIRQSWPPRRHVWPACCGNCGQGARICPTPEACQMADEDDNSRFWDALTMAIWAASVCLVITLLASVLGVIQ